jgi:heat shock protein HslJ
MKKLIFPVMAIVLIGLFCGCKTSKKGVSNDNLPLVGTQWNLVAIEGVEIGNDFALRPFLKFDSANNINGNLGCNTLFGTYTVNKKQKMNIEFQGATKRLCQQMSVERQFLKALKRDIDRYQIQGSELILFEEEFEIMRFSGVDLGKVE